MFETQTQFSLVTANDVKLIVIGTDGKLYWDRQIGNMGECEPHSLPTGSILHVDGGDRARKYIAHLNWYNEVKDAWLRLRCDLERVHETTKALAYNDNEVIHNIYEIRLRIDDILSEIDYQFQTRCNACRS